MNFIIYEDEKGYVERYKKVICKLLGPTTLNYKIIEISEYNQDNKLKLDKIDGNWIYILDIEVHAEFVNTFSGIIDLSRLNEIDYSTKGETHGVGLPLVNKITRQNKRFKCGPKIMNNFFIQHLIIKIFNKENLQKISKNWHFITKNNIFYILW